MYGSGIAVYDKKSKKSSNYCGIMSLILNNNYSQSGIADNADDISYLC
jgi:hypothetical protein